MLNRPPSPSSKHRMSARGEPRADDRSVGLTLGAREIVDRNETGFNRGF